MKIIGFQPSFWWFIGFLPSPVNTKQISGMIMGCLPSTNCYQVVSGISHQNMLRLCKVCNGVFFMKAWVYFWVDFGEIASWVYDVFYTQHSDRHQLGIHAYRLAVCGIKPCHFEITEAISILIETIKSDIRWYQPNTLWSWKRYHITHHSLQSLSGLSWLDAYQWATPFCCKIYLHKKKTSDGYGLQPIYFPRTSNHSIDAFISA